MGNIPSGRPYMTSVADDWYIQQQQGDSMVFIHRLSVIGWDKTFNRFVRTDRISIKFSPNIIRQQGMTGAAIICISGVLTGENNPDLNPTEHVWDELRHHVQTNHAINTVNNLAAAIQVEWDNLPAPYTQRYVNSMHRQWHQSLNKMVDTRDTDSFPLTYNPFLLLKSHLKWI